MLFLFPCFGNVGTVGFWGFVEIFSGVWYNGEKTLEEKNMKSSFCTNCPCKVPGKECVFCYWNKDNDDSNDYDFDNACTGSFQVGNDGFHIVGNKKKSK